MAHYSLTTLPPAGLARGILLAAVADEGATVYQRADGSHVESRASWASPPAGPDPATLTETPADPVATLGWTLLAAPPS